MSVPAVRTRRTRTPRGRAGFWIGGAGIAMIMVAVLVDEKGHDPAAVALGIVGLLVALAGAAFATTFEAVKLARLIQDLPTSRIRSAHQGYVEVGGVVRAGGPLIRCGKCGRACLWFQYYTSKDEDYRVTPQVAPDIILDDGTGQCRIRAHGCELVTAAGDHGHVHLGPGDAVHVLGEFRADSIGAAASAGAVPASSAPAADLRQRLERVKRDQERMKLFDRNRDGFVDLREWEAAVKAVRYRMERETPAEREGVNPVNAIGLPRAELDDRPFVIFIGTEQEALVAAGRQLFWRAAVLVVLAGVVLYAL